MDRECSTNVEEKEGKKRPLGRPRLGWVDNIKMDPREIGLDGIGWNSLTQDKDKWRAPVKRQ
jgi:hypothetical protein